MADTLKKILDPHNLVNEIDETLIQDYEDPLIKKNYISFEEWEDRFKKYQEAYENFGEDPLFSQFFGSYHPLNSVQFLSPKDQLRVLEFYNIKTAIKQQVARNPTHARILNKLNHRKQVKQELEKEENKNLLESIIINKEEKTD